MSFDELPFELVCATSKYLVAPRDLFAFAGVCRRTRRAAQQTRLWPMLQDDDGRRIYLRDLRRQKPFTSFLAIEWAVRHQLPQTATWIVRTFALSAADARASENKALRAACHNGHLPVTQWLRATFHLD